MADIKNYIISYPKSGRTWLRTLIGKYLCLKYDLSEEKMLVTKHITRKAGLLCTIFHHDGSQMIHRRPYWELPNDKTWYERKNALILSREVKDTVVSGYFFSAKRLNLHGEPLFQGTLSEYVRDDRYGAKKTLIFYKNWAEQKHIPRRLSSVRYEEMHENAGGVLEKSLRFIGEKKISWRAVEGAVKFCSFENLKRLGLTNKYKDSVLAPGDPDDPESYKMRQGKIGGHADYLSQEDIDYIDGLMEEFGCEFTQDAVP